MQDEQEDFYFCFYNSHFISMVTIMYFLRKEKLGAGGHYWEKNQILNLLSQLSCSFLQLVTHVCVFTDSNDTNKT